MQSADRNVVWIVFWQEIANNSAPCHWSSDSLLI